MPLPQNRYSEAIARCGLIALAAISVSCDRTSSDYYPLETGRWWVYAINETVLDEDRVRRYVVRNRGLQREDARRVAVQHAQLHTRDHIATTEAGVEQISRRHQMNGQVSIDTNPRMIVPLDRMRKWSVNSSLGLVESRTFARQDRIRVRRFPVMIEKHVAATSERISTPVGTFDDCLRIDGEGRRSVQTDRGNSVAEVVVHTREWFAPGIGLVKLERSEESTSTFLKPGLQEWELIDYG